MINRKQYEIINQAWKQIEKYHEDKDKRRLAFAMDLIMIVMDEYAIQAYNSTEKSEIKKQDILNALREKLHHH